MKAGFLSKHHEGRVSKASAWAESLGYCANICLSLHKLQLLNLQEQQLLRKVQDHCRVSSGEGGREGGMMGLIERAQLVGREQQ